MSWVSLNAQWALASGAIRYEHKTMSVEDCDYNWNHSLGNSSIVHQEDPEEVFPLYRISYMWYTFFGAMVTITISILCSVIWGTNDPKTIDPKLIAPFLRPIFHGKNYNKNLIAKTVFVENVAQNSNESKF